MLAINMVDYYNRITKELEGLYDFIEFMNDNDLALESQNILRGILNSQISSNSNCFNYTVKRGNSSAPETLRSNYIEHFSQFKRNFNMVKFIEALTVVKMNINDIFGEFNYCDESVSGLLLDLVQLTTMHQKIISSEESKDEIILFFDKLQECVIEYNTVVKGLRSCIGSIFGTYNIDNISGENVMELQLLDVEYSVREFGALLLSIDKAYNSIASILSKELSVETLKIVKIESGSLFSKTSGDERILQVIAIILKRVSDYIHNNFTRSGRLEVNSLIMKEISNDAEILKKLKEAGMDTKESKVNIENAFNAATNELFKIASSTPRLKINGNEINIADKQVYLEYKTQLLDKPETIDEETDESPSEN